jgi:hypothetical protein
MARLKSRKKYLHSDGGKLFTSDPAAWREHYRQLESEAEAAAAWPAVVFTIPGLTGGAR